VEDMQNDTTQGRNLKVEYVNLSQASDFFADRQNNVTTEEQAHRTLTSIGSYNAGYDKNFPYPPPSGEKGHSAKMLLYIHRLNEYNGLLQKLLDADSVKFYDPRTLLRVRDASEISDPFVKVDEVARQLIEFAEAEAEAEAAPAEATTDTKTQSQKKVSRKSELIELMEKIYIQDNDQPNNNAMWNRLKKDNSGIIKTMEGNVIEWVSYRENVQKMQRTTFNNNMSKIRNLHK
jgi:hypothetical protein